MKKIILLLVICLMTVPHLAKQIEPIVQITPAEIIHARLLLFTVSSILAAILFGLISTYGNYYPRVFYRKRVRTLRGTAILLLCIIGIITLFTLPTATVGEYSVIGLGFAYVILVSNNDNSFSLNLIASIAFLMYISMIHIFLFQNGLTPLIMLIAFIISFVTFSFLEGSQKWVKFSKEKLEELWDWILIGIFKYLMD